jgi:hypothetical protein
MTCLPIVERELRVRARLKSTYRLRLFAALGAILLASFLLLAVEATAAASGMGRRMFQILAWVSFLYCLTEGARNTADCLSSEKRAGTLGLLFLTDLRGYDVVLGKLMATSLNSFYGLLAIFPPLAIPLVIGGVTVGEFWRLVLVLLNTLFFSLTTGLLVSAVSRDERHAWGGTVAVTLLFAAFPPLTLLGKSGSASLLDAVGPTVAFLNLFDAAYNAAPNNFWEALRNTHFLSWVFLIAATWVLPHTWQDRPLHSQSDAARTLPSDLTKERGRNERENRRRLLEANPVVWLVSRGRYQRVLLWILVGLGGGALVAGWLLVWRLPGARWFLFFSIVIPFLILAMIVASEACHQFVTARHSGALELLLCTPLTTKQIVTGHFLGLRRIFFQPVVTFLSISAGVLLIQIGLLTIFQKRLDALETFGLVGFQLLVSVMDLFAVGYFGMWMGLSQKTPGKAVTKTVLYVLVLPGIAVFAPYFGPLIGVAKNLMFINYAQEQLRRRFRFIVTERYGMVEEPELAAGGRLKAPTAPWPAVLKR